MIFEGIDSEGFLQYPQRHCAFRHGNFPFKWPLLKTIKKSCSKMHRALNDVVIANCGVLLLPEHHLALRGLPQ